MTNSESKVRFVSWTQFGQLLGAFSIAASLFLVAWEMKQSREIAEAELYLGRTNFDVAMYDHDYQVERHQAIVELHKKGSIADLTDEAYYLLWTDEHHTFASIDTAHFHWQRGLINDEDWAAYLEAFAYTCQGQLLELQEHAWNHGHGYRKEFARAINDAMTASKQKCADLSEQDTSQKAVPTDQPTEAETAPEEANS